MTAAPTASRIRSVCNCSKTAFKFNEHGYRCLCTQPVVIATFSAPLPDGGSRGVTWWQGDRWRCDLGRLYIMGWGGVSEAYLEPRGGGGVCSLLMGQLDAGGCS